MPNFLKDSPLSRNLTEKEIDNLLLALQHIQMTIEGYTSTDRDNIERYNSKYYKNNIPTKTNMNSTKIDILRAEIGAKLGNFGKKRQGFPTGLVSKKVELVENLSKQCFDIVKKPKSDLSRAEVEHIFPIKFQVLMIIQDYLDGRWKFEVLEGGKLGDFENGQKYVEINYPIFHLTTITTREENMNLVPEINRIIEHYKASDKVTPVGQHDMESVRKAIENAEHYKRNNIVFYKDVTLVGIHQHHFQLVSSSYKELMGKRIIKKSNPLKKFLDK